MSATRKTPVALRSLSAIALLALTLLATSGCSVFQQTRDALAAPHENVTLTPRTSTYRDLKLLPEPRGHIPIVVYGFRDQTGQYKAAPSSSFSTAVTQGGAAMLTNVLHESGWFSVLEREGLQNLLTERKIIRSATAKAGGKKAADGDDGIAPLLSASILLEGGVVAYDSDVRTGGIGVRYLGISSSEQYRVDQVTVNLRAIDIRSGRVLVSVLTTKSLLSREVQAGVFRFIEFKKLLEADAGYTTNEPAQLCLLSAMESAVIHMIAQGVDQKLWSVSPESRRADGILKSYLGEYPIIGM